MFELPAAERIDKQIRSEVLQSKCTRLMVTPGVNNKLDLGLVINHFCYWNSACLQ